MFTADMPKSMKLKLKGGAYVDPESGLEHDAHVLKRGNDLYSVVLGAVNIQTGMNSYYKLQLLQHDNKNKYGKIYFCMLFFSHFKQILYLDGTFSAHGAVSELQSAGQSWRIITRRKTLCRTSCSSTKTKLATGTFCLF